MDFIELLQTFLVSLTAALVFMSLIFVIARRMRRYDLVDVAWGLVFIVITITAFMVNGAIDTTRIVLLVLVGIWGFRLASHIYRRLRATDSEDKRYVELRKKWQSKNEDLAIYLRIYCMQALLAALVCAPVIVSMASDANQNGLLLTIGIGVWVIGFTIESLADRQLRKFIADATHKGQLMTRGLWRYSRHPNYFGEVTMWWGVGIIALGVPFAWIGLVGPLLISYLIIFVSGVPPTEKAFAGRPGWKEYQQRTSVLVPWFVRSKDNA